MNFQILGPVRVVTDDGCDVPLGGAKQSELLACLLLRANEVVSSDRLIDELWGEQPPPTAAKTLQVYVSRLRHALGDEQQDLLVTRNGGYVLRVEPADLDAARFEVLVGEGSAALADGKHGRAASAMRSALALWRGEPLSNLGCSSLAQTEIARLEGLRLVAAEGAVEAELALGRHAEVIPELEALVAKHPLSERLRAQLMLALYRAGRQADALEAYRGARRVLVGELGIEPGPDLRELERAILAQDESLAAPVKAAPRRSDARRSPSGLFVGYELELSSLEESLERALAGRGGVALLSGEPGIGKTRLADELAAVATARGASVHWGRCSADGGAPAYWPWIQILRSIVRAADPAALRADLVGPAGDVVQLVPELSDSPRAAARVEDGEEARFRLFDAVAEFLRAQAARSPLAIVLDDLQIADEASLALLRFLGTALADQPLLVVATHRDAGPDTNEPLRETVAELARTGECTRVALRGLTPEATAHFVEVTAGAAPLPRLAGAIHTASGGNPLFVRELVRLLGSEGQLRELDAGEELILPRAVGDVIVQRLGQLSPTTREALMSAAVLGREFELGVVERMTAQPPELLIEQIDEARRAGVVEEVDADAGSIRFSHELIRSALYNELSAAARGRAHAAAGAALEQLHADDLAPCIAELAHHFAAAVPRDHAKAIGYLTEAGDQGAELAAPEAAIRFYERAIAVARASTDDARLLAELQVKLAEQFVLLGDVERTTRAVEAAAAQAAVVGDHALRARLEVVQTQLDLFGPCEAGRDRVLAAIKLFQDLDDRFNEARAWRALNMIDYGKGKPETAAEAASQMLRCAGAAGSNALAAWARKALASALASGSTPAREALPRVLALRTPANGPAVEARIVMYAAHLKAALGDRDGARSDFDAARQLVSQSLEGEDALSMIDMTQAEIERIDGDLARAEELARAAAASLERRGLVGYLRSQITSLIDALIAQGKLDEATAEYERAASMSTLDDDDAVFRQARSRARLMLAKGDLAEAERAMRTAREYVRRNEMAIDQAETMILDADLWSALGRDDEARAAAQRALLVAQRKGHVALTEQARGRLAAVVA